MNVHCEFRRFSTIFSLVFYTTTFLLPCICRQVNANSIDDAQSGFNQGFSSQEFSDFSSASPVMFVPSTFPGSRFRDQKILIQNTALYSSSEKKIDLYDDAIQNISRVKYRFKNNTTFELYGTKRKKIVASFNNNTGFLNAHPYNQFALEHASLFNISNKKNQWVLGNYAIGLGSDLTFSTMSRQRLDGIAITEPYMIDYSSGKIASTRQLQGLAFQSTRRLNQNEITMTLFSSYQLIDLHQLNIEYGPDEWNEPLLGDCIDVNTQIGQYQCNDTGKWSTNFISMSSNNMQPLKHAILENAVEEKVFGQHLALNTSSHRLGFINYFAKININFDSPNSNFTESSPFQNKSNFQAFGIYYQYRGNFTINTEVSRFQKQGLAAKFELSYPLNTYWNMSGESRYSSADFTNPYAGNNTMSFHNLRNHYGKEQGLRILLSGKYPKIEIKSKVYIWRGPKYEFSDISRQQLKSYASPDLSIQQQIDWRLNNTVTWGVFTRLDNKNIYANGRQQVFLDADDYMSGERRDVGVKFKIDYKSQKHSVYYKYRWQDVEKYTHRFDTARTIRYSGVVSMRPSLRMTTFIDYRIKHIPISGVFAQSFHNYKTKASFSMENNIYQAWQVSLRADLLTFEQQRNTRITTSLQLTYHGD